VCFTKFLKILLAWTCFNFHGSSNAQEISAEAQYGYTFSTPSACESLSVDSFILNMQKLAEYCEFVNLKQEEQGYPRCPTYMCPNARVPGTDADPGPSVKIVVSNQNNQYGSYYGSYSSIYGGGSSNGNAQKTLWDRINISIELTLPLSKRVDEQSCYFPMTPDLVKETMIKINQIAAERKSKSCE
jgi:hypothetical protein